MVRRPRYWSSTCGRKSGQKCKRNSLASPAPGIAPGAGEYALLWPQLRQSAFTSMEAYCTTWKAPRKIQFTSVTNSLPGVKASSRVSTRCLIGIALKPGADARVHLQHIVSDKSGYGRGVHSR